MSKRRVWFLADRPAKSTVIRKTILAVASVLSVGGTPLGSAQNSNSQQAFDNIARRQQLDLEERKIALEEKRLYLSTLEHSQLTEEKAHEISVWLLKNLKDYPKGNKAKHIEDDLKLLTETLATLRKSDTPPQPSK